MGYVMSVHLNGVHLTSTLWYPLASSCRDIAAVHVCVHAWWGEGGWWIRVCVWCVHNSYIKVCPQLTHMTSHYM